MCKRDLIHNHGTFMIFFFCISLVKKLSTRFSRNLKPKANARILELYKISYSPFPVSLAQTLILLIKHPVATCYVLLNI